MNYLLKINNRIICIANQSLWIIPGFRVEVQKLQNLMIMKLSIWLIHLLHSLIITHSQLILTKFSPLSAPVFVKMTTFRKIPFSLQNFVFHAEAHQQILTPRAKIRMLQDG